MNLFNCPAAHIIDCCFENSIPTIPSNMAPARRPWDLLCGVQVKFTVLLKSTLPQKFIKPQKYFPCWVFPRFFFYIWLKYVFKIKLTGKSESRKFQQWQIFRLWLAAWQRRNCNCQLKSISYKLFCCECFSRVFVNESVKRIRTCIKSFSLFPACVNRGEGGLGWGGGFFLRTHKLRFLDISTFGERYIFHMPGLAIE